MGGIAGDQSRCIALAAIIVCRDTWHLTAHHCWTVCFLLCKTRWLGKRASVDIRCIVLNWAQSRLVRAFGHGSLSGHGLARPGNLTLVLETGITHNSILVWGAPRSANSYTNRVIAPVCSSIRAGAACALQTNAACLGCPTAFDCSGWLSRGKYYSNWTCCSLNAHGSPLDVVSGSG